MLCDDTVERLCSVFRNQDNATEVDNKQSARLRVFFCQFFITPSLHSFENLYSFRVGSLINVISGNE